MRIHYFSGNLPDHALELDNEGIPAVAYWNTKGDHPVKAEQLVNAYAWKVTYKED